MDLSNLDVVSEANKGAVLELLHPSTGEVLTDESKEKKEKAIKDNGKLSDEQKETAIEKLSESKPFYLRLLGSDSDTYRNAIKRRVEKNAKKKSNNVDLDEAQLKAAELLAKCTTDCYMIEDGKEVECTRSEMTRLYLKYPWIREQAEEFMGDRSNLKLG